MARNGRLMIIGFASAIEAEDEPTVTPRALCFGNVSIGGVLLSYRDDPSMTKRAKNPGRAYYAIHGPGA